MGGAIARRTKLNARAAAMRPMLVKVWRRVEGSHAELPIR